MAQMRLWPKKASRAAFSVLFPDSCLACGAGVSRQGVVCPRCWQELHLIEEPLCQISGAPFSLDFGPGMISAEAIANPPEYDKARAVAVHAGIASRLVRRLKYADRTDLARWMAAWMLRAGAELVEDSDVIVPVPLHRWRYFARRYNQSAELGRVLAKSSDKSFAPEALARGKRTRSQVGLTRDQRNRNVQGAFKVLPEHEILVSGRRILLIDDVLTTGATVNACAKALKRGGAAKVNVLTFSRVVPGYLPDERR